MQQHMSADLDGQGDKRRLWPRRAKLAALAGTLLLAGIATVYVIADQNAGTPSPPAASPSVELSPPPRFAVVTYEVLGTGRVDITYVDPGKTSSVILRQQRLPWRLQLPRQAVTYVEILGRRQDYEDNNPHMARILIDGIELCRNSSSPGYREAGCDGPVPQI